MGMEGRGPEPGVEHHAGRAGEAAGVDCGVRAGAQQAGGYEGQRPRFDGDGVVTPPRKVVGLGKGAK